ncbi:MAG: DUF4328 domain-containing protein [Alcaligenaceae bacterium]|nr:DUF4328 domain-containing protein [Alcaligenaceae bacterium]
MSDMNTGFRNTDTLTRWVKYMLYLKIIIVVFSIFSNFAEYQLLNDVSNGVYISMDELMRDAQASDDRQTLVGLFSIFIFVITNIFILRWIYLANDNAHRLGAVGMKFTPGWSIGYFFLPILNLWKPYQAMKEIYQVSQNPHDWQFQSGTNILGIWWAIWIINGFLGNIIFRFSQKAEEVDQMLTLNLVSQVSDVMDIVSAVLFLFLVKQIHEMQKKHAYNK